MVILILIFSDGLIPIDSLPFLVSWMATIDPLYHLVRCGLIIEFFGEIYPRTLAEHEEEFCEVYHEHMDKIEITPEKEEEIDALCATQLSYRYVFEAVDLDPNDEGVLYIYWGYILVICVAVRILSVMLLVIINHDGFGWISKQIKQRGCCIGEDEDDDFGEISLEFNDEESDLSDDTQPDVNHEEVHIIRDVDRDNH